MSTASGRVTPLRRPPVRQSVVVRSDRRHTFGTFVSTIGIWWPVTPFSAGRDRVRDVTFEQRQGGRVYETWQDGTEIEWGELLMIGPFANSQQDGAMGIFTTRAAAEEFVRGDPFVLHGVVQSWTIREWNEALVPE
jgi:hypothetical protein